jgi:peptide methionine sulfoxide reductase MsrA
VTKISEAGPFWQAEAEDQDYLQHYPHGTNQFRPQRPLRNSRRLVASVGS